MEKLTKQIMYDIFISYRREDGKEFARQLELKLQNLGYRTFLDVEELKDGVFDKRIIDAIEASTVFLALLTPRYFCRCAEEEDWVRKEIVCAVEGKKHIVPVNIDRLFKNFPEDCPQIIRDNIGQHQFTEVFTGQQFTNTMEYLDVNRLQPYIVKVEKVQEGAIIHIDADMDCQIEIFGKQICTVQAGADQEIRLLKGTKKIKAISLDNPKDYIEFKFTVPDNESEELLEIKLQPVKEAREQQEKDNFGKNKKHDMYDIFISYRREDGKDLARQLYLKLQTFGYKVFLDVEELQSGDFNKSITEALDSSKVFLPILTPAYFSRFANQEDFVRGEMECAIKNNKQIVPVVIDREFQDFPEDCPQFIKDNIVQLQFAEVFTGQQFNTTMGYLDKYRLQPNITK